MNTKNKKKILFTCADFGGGIGKMLRFVISQCAIDFNEIVLLHRGRESNNDVVPKYVKEIIRPCDFHKPMLFWRYKHIKEIHQVIKNERPSIVCCFGAEMSVMVTIAMFGIKNTKLVLAERGDPFTAPLIWKLLNKIAFRFADNCVFQLEKQGKWYGQRVMNKSIIIPNAFIPTGVVSQFLGERKKKIVSVGRFVYEKRYEVLIQAFKNVHDFHHDYELVLYGDGDYKEKYEALIVELGLENCVHMPGYTNNAMLAISDSSVFVLSSLYEGMPNTLIEAMAVGVPTVSTDCNPGGPDFLTDHGRRGLLVPLNDVNAMSAAICRIIEDPILAKRLSNLGQEIIPLLAVDRIGKMWVDFFKSIL